MDGVRLCASKCGGLYFVNIFVKTKLFAKPFYPVKKSQKSVDTTALISIFVYIFYQTIFFSLYPSLLFCP